jgi:RNA polymerase sigma-70 factor, ECF subfamily
VLEADGQLVRRAQSGDVEAFTEIFRRYHPVVHRFARGMTCCPAAAEDVSQEAFLAVLRDLERYDPHRASFTTYLFGIVRNLSRERSRKDWRFAALDALDRPDEHEIYVDDPSAALEAFELASHLRRGLRQLPHRYRAVIVLCDLHGLSYANAAAVVGVSPSAVRSRLYRGRQLLRHRLGRIL